MWTSIDSSYERRVWNRSGLAEIEQAGEGDGKRENRKNPIPAEHTNAVSHA